MQIHIIRFEFNVSDTVGKIWSEILAEVKKYPDLEFKGVRGRIIENPKTHEVKFLSRVILTK